VPVIHTKLLGFILLFHQQHWRRKYTAALLDQTLVQHVLDLLLHLIFHSKGQPIRSYIHRLSSLYERDSMITRSARWKVVRLLKKVTKLIQQLLNLWWQLTLLQVRLMIRHKMQLNQ
jgi:hypothetical protein